MTSRPLLIDSHCHLDFDYSPKETEDLVREAEAAGIGTLINVGTEMRDLPRLESTSARFPNVFHTVGVHPHEAQTIQEGDLSRLKEASQNPKCLAIGEIGLDYHYDNSPREIQRVRFDEQLALALEVDLPVVIHTRDAESDSLTALKKYVENLSKDSIPGVIHCFTGTKEFGQACLDLGFYISFSGIVTFKRAEDLQQAAQLFPLDRLLVETDSPFLAPIPLRGKKCEPYMVTHTAQKLAELKGVDFDHVVQTTRKNTIQVFRMQNLV